MNDGFERVTAWLAAQNHPHAPMALPVAARTAREAADGLGVALGQIAKSVIFRRLADDVAVLVVASGDRRVDERKVAAITGPLGRADARFVKERTGFSIAPMPSISTRTTSPAPNRADRIACASGFSSCCWIARLSGRAP